MFAAESLVRTLIAHGVDTCFTNPGTSEMHMVAALDRTEGMRSVLCLFEGVATGAADGFARMAGRPACTLLHLGPGLANGLANLHNARRARVPVVNIVGDHARHHRALDAPLTSDIVGLCQPMSRWVGEVERPEDIATLAATAVRQSFGPGPAVASLVLPADCAWATCEPEIPAALDPPGLEPVAPPVISTATKRLKAARKPAFLLGHHACLDQGLLAAARLAKATGGSVFMDTFVTRIARGHGRFAPQRLPYFAEEALAALDGHDLLLIAGTTPPVSFFAYPDRPGSLVPDGMPVETLAGPDQTAGQALEALADMLDASENPELPAASKAPPLDPDTPLNPGYVGISLLRHMPENSVICDDATTSGMGVFPWLTQGPRHDWLCLTGGAIGSGMPQAIGAALACPQRQVFALCGDGAAAYTLQALWTQAREKLDIVNVVFANHSYLVLNVELARVGAGDPGEAARQMLSLEDPRMDWVKLAEGFGVSGRRATTAGEFDSALAAALAAGGPQLIVAEI
ncbi:acetolactate synthase large subunit [Maricaulis sp. CAU 1757]